MWADKGVVKFYSDEGNLINPDRIQPLIDYASKKFKTKTVLLDGELILNGVHRKDITGYLHSKGTAEAVDAAKVRFIVWDLLYFDKSLAAEPFQTRSQALDRIVSYKPKQAGKIQRVHHVEVSSRAGVAAAVKKITSNEGAVIRDLEAAYWATHSTYKMKKVFDVDARIFAVEKTEGNLPVFHMVTAEGVYIGKTYAQGSVQGKVGDVIRVNVNHVSLKPDGSIGWFAPTPTSSKGTKEIGRPDGIGLLREIFIGSGGAMEEWNAWIPKHREWVKNVMPKLLERFRSKS
jgi:ATP-dependent DNA ligase